MPETTPPGSASAVERPTLLLIFVTYAAWALATAYAPAMGLWLALPVATLATSFHVSLTHEAVHGHPTRWPALNHLLVGPAISLFVPHERYRDQHLAHHHDPNLTDPYDDPESYYLDPARWVRLARPVKVLMTVNNTLLGRITIGPALGLACFVGADAAAMFRGDRTVIRAWALHVPAVGAVGLWLATAGAMPLWAVLASGYGAMSLQKVRSYLEHRAHPRARGRTVIVEDRGPLAFLFLNNNLHAVHHAHPRVPWYALPALYRQRRGHFLRRNFGYRYDSYAQVFRAYLLRAKDPVPHPLMPAPPKPAVAAALAAMGGPGPAQPAV